MGLELNLVGLKRFDFVASHTDHMLILARGVKAIEKVLPKDVLVLMGFELLQKSINKPKEDNLHTSSSKDTGQTLPSSFHRHKRDTEAHTHSLFGYNPRRKDNSLSKYTMF